ncbi:hypothetical protein GYMLUDRAFT_56670 [Collybiopsis luxurians FD-317 M1]|nr:hypothetical protein GYMLUDRAFT_56670 [Collybiopsis luxurians FD-317 M1]
MEVIFVEDVAFMDQLCGDILNQVDPSPSSQSPHLLVTLSTQFTIPSSSIQAIQISTYQKNIVFKTSQIHSQALFPPALQAILTGQFIIKLGYQVKQSLLEIAKCYNDTEIYTSLKANPAILETGQHARLKGAVTNPAAPLDILAGSILNKSFSLPPAPSVENWSSNELYVQKLYDQVHWIWQMYRSLYTCDSVGLPLFWSRPNIMGIL